MTYVHRQVKLKREFRKKTNLKEILSIPYIISAQPFRNTHLLKYLFKVKSII